MMFAFVSGIFDWYYPINQKDPDIPYALVANMVAFVDVDKIDWKLRSKRTAH